MTYVANPAEAKKPGPRLALALITIAVGTVLGIAGLAIAISKVVHDFNGEVYSAPGPIHRTLKPGTYEVFEGVVSSTDNTPRVAAIRPSQVVVLGAQNGTQITTNSVSSTETLGTGHSEYLGVVEFKIVTEGDYVIGVKDADGEPFFVTNSFGDLAKHAAGWFVMMGIGMLVGFIGVIMLIVGIVRRRNAKQAAGGPYGGGFPQQPYQPGAPMGTTAAAGAPVAAANPAAGWYPDPQTPGTQRWWDGTRWTDQTQNS